MSFSQTTISIPPSQALFRLQISGKSLTKRTDSTENLELSEILWEAERPTNSPESEEPSSEPFLINQISNREKAELLTETWNACLS
ncbi:hypothetical protein GWI33_023244 [Rhynchophorus ferrugineus]|uniref:Uncharacterized protein n=1 Tax=Rhynchophorus ferrugineus TaxID=354439 RepID=A0A834IM92_RHYFE|nr:hypothetical protein GWI33_023244 [Rhynchophorus ferrugineus]